MEEIGDSFRFGLSTERVIHFGGHDMDRNGAKIAGYAVQQLLQITRRNSQTLVVLVVLQDELAMTRRDFHNKDRQTVIGIGRDAGSNKFAAVIRAVVEAGKVGTQQHQVVAQPCAQAKRRYLVAERWTEERLARELLPVAHPYVGIV